MRGLRHGPRDKEAEDKECRGKAGQRRLGARTSAAGATAVIFVVGSALRLMVLRDGRIRSPRGVVKLTASNSEMGRHAIKISCTQWQRPLQRCAVQRGEHSAASPNAR